MASWLAYHYLNRHSARWHGSGKGKGLTPLFCILLLNLLCMSRRTFNFLRTLDDSSRVEITYTQNVRESEFSLTHSHVRLISNLFFSQTQLPVRCSFIARWKCGTVKYSSKAVFIAPNCQNVIFAPFENTIVNLDCESPHCSRMRNNYGAVLNDLLVELF